jgi:uncharacterized protein (TIGR00730 family)
MTLVYGGGNIGLMGVLADGALDAGGRVVGVIPQALLEKELGHGGVTELRVVGTMHERKAMMADLSDAFLALPGGFGTLDELCEILTWSQLGIHAKPIGLLNQRGYFDSFLAFLDRSVVDGFLRAEHRNLLLVGDDPAEVIDRIVQTGPRSPLSVDAKIQRRDR